MAHGIVSTGISFPDGSIQVGATPTGAVIAYAGSAAPTGWLFCYGQAVSRTTYAALFTAIGASYGAGDGSTTFNLPDLRGRAVAGVDNMGGTTAGRITSAGAGITGTTLGAAGGAQTVALTEAQMPSHYHSVTTVGGEGYPQSYSGLAVAGNTNQYAYNTNSKGSGSTHQNTQPTIMLNYIIKV